jgi:hypothetical protein
VRQERLLGAGLQPEQVLRRALEPTVAEQQVHQEAALAI